MKYALFSGPGSLRDPSERIAFWLTALCSIPAALLIGFLLHESIGASQVALFIVVAMIYVTLARGKLLGSSVRIHAAQYPRVFEIVKRACAALDIPMPLIFVREDNLVPVAALGFGEPYSLVISSHWIEAFQDDELAFMIGRELGHIAAGHTRFLSLLSVNGNESPLISLIFGAWLRRCTFTCDKVGLLCCGSIDAAIRAMGVAAFHHFGRKIDYRAFAEQSTEIADDPVLRWGAWLGSEPYATLRIASLRRFISTHAYSAAEEWFLRERQDEPPSLAAPGTTTVVLKDCAGWWRRAGAYAIDTIVVGCILLNFGSNPVAVHRSHTSAPVNVNISNVPAPPNPPTASNTAKPGAAAATRTSPSPAPTETDEHLGPVTIHGASVIVNGKKVATIAEDRDQTGSGDDEESEAATNEPAKTESGGDVWVSPFVDFPPFVFLSRVAELGPVFWVPVYLALLVGVAGQSFGMMICGLRVVTLDFRRPGIGQTIWRYLVEGILFIPIVLASFIWRRVLLHDKLSKTRVVKTERILARDAGTLTK